MRRKMSADDAHNTVSLEQLIKFLDKCYYPKAPPVKVYVFDDGRDSEATFVQTGFIWKQLIAMHDFDEGNLLVYLQETISAEYALLPTATAARAQAAVRQVAAMVPSQHGLHGRTKEADADENAEEACSSSAALSAPSEVLTKMQPRQIY